MLRGRLREVRRNATFALQSGVAAGAAWLVAHNLLHHERPFFAPIAAVIVLNASGGLRWHRALELVFGVALGIAVADLFVYLVGVGVLQIAAVVTLAILFTVLLGGRNLAIAQAAASAIIVVALSPPDSVGLNLERFVDALVGGGVGLLVMVFVLPHDPLARVRGAAGEALGQLDAALKMTAQALTESDPALARRALSDLRRKEAQHEQLAEELTLGSESVLLAPLRWRDRSALERYRHSAVHVERATRNTRVLARRSATAIKDAEPVPAALGEALRTLASAVTCLEGELAADAEPAGTRDLALRAVRISADAYRDGVGFSGAVVVAQVRSAAVDLLRATGLSEADADRWVDRAAGRGPRRGPGVASGG